MTSAKTPTVPPFRNVLKDPKYQAAKDQTAALSQQFPANGARKEWGFNSTFAPSRSGGWTGVGPLRSGKEGGSLDPSALPAPWLPLTGISILTHGHQSFPTHLSERDLSNANARTGVVAVDKNGNVYCGMGN